MEMADTSKTKIYNVRLMSTLDKLSKQLQGHSILPEFLPPGKPTGKIENRNHASFRSKMPQMCYLKLPDVTTSHFQQTIQVSA